MNDAIFAAARGYVYEGRVGTAAITPEQVKSFDPDTYGAASVTLTVTGEKSNTFTITPKIGEASNTKKTEPLSATATAGEIQAALEAVDVIGTGNVVVKETSDKGVFTIFLIGTHFGEEFSGTADATGGTAAIKVKDKASGWKPAGQTSEEDLPEFGYEGGDKETKGTWQKDAIREVTTEKTQDYVTIKLVSFDDNSLEWYYGKNQSKTPFVFGVESSDGASIERALQIVIVDGDYKIGFSAAKTSIRRDESITLAKDDFSTLPVRATFIKHPGRMLFEWVRPAE